jgi:hypothetical protein
MVNIMTEPPKNLHEWCKKKDCKFYPLFNSKRGGTRIFLFKCLCCAHKEFTDNYVGTQKELVNITMTTRRNKPLKVELQYNDGTTRILKGKRADGWVGEVSKEKLSEKLQRNLVNGMMGL